MTVLLFADERFADHDPGKFHPEAPRRLQALRNGLRSAGLEEALEVQAPRPATDEELLAVHEQELLSLLKKLGGGTAVVDPDTRMSSGSLLAARLAAGAGLAAIDALSVDRLGAPKAAFCAVRPPGHHATISRSMGFCLFNNVAVAGAALRSLGKRVLIVDYDAHHGNGTQGNFLLLPGSLLRVNAPVPRLPGHWGSGRTRSRSRAGDDSQFAIPSWNDG